MTIRIPFSTILYDLFPEAKGERDALLAAMRAYYTVRGVVSGVLLFMVDALTHFKGQSLSTIKEAATEIAMLGTQGIHPREARLQTA